MFEQIRGRIALNLKGYRVTNGMTQKEMAKKIGISRGAVARIESQERVPSMATYAKICTAANMKPEDLVRLRTAKFKADVEKKQDRILKERFYNSNKKKVK